MLKSTGSGKKWLKLTQSRKSHICGIQSLSVNRHVKNARAISKEAPSVVLIHFQTFYCKNIVNKSVCWRNFSFSKPWRTSCFLKILKKRNQFSCTDLLPNPKLVHLNGKNFTRFIQNLVQNLMKLVLNSKIKNKVAKKWLKLKQFRK